MIQSMQIGPLSLPLEVVVLLLAIFTALIVGNLSARKSGADAESRIYRIVLVSLVVARLVFVWQQREAYAATPWSVLDIRDGGWSPWAGLLAALLYSTLIAVRAASLRKPILLALGAAGGIWLGGMALMDVPPSSSATLADFSVSTFDGQPVALASFTGKPTVVNLWASWCPPCRREMPAFARAQDVYPEVNFLFLNQGESAATIRSFLSTNQLALRNVLLDQGGVLARSFNLRGMPATLFFDANGDWIDTRLGELSYASLVQRIGRIDPADR